MPRMILPSYTVIRDTREKEGFGWEFKQHKPERRPPRCDGMIEQTLKTGDYSLVGYEDLLVIERKDNYSELWVNYGKRDLFEEEMERMRNIKYKYVLIETQLTTDIFNLSPPQFTRGVPGKALVNWLSDLSVKYGVPIIPVGSCGKQYAQSIFESVIRTEKDRWATA
jgi:hypothetical protein